MNLDTRFHVPLLHSSRKSGAWLVTNCARGANDVRWSFIADAPYYFATINSFLNDAIDFSSDRQGLPGIVFGIFNPLLASELRKASQGFARLCKASHGFARLGKASQC